MVFSLFSVLFLEANFIFCVFMIESEKKKLDPGYKLIFYHVYLKRNCVFQINLRLILVSGKTKEFLFPPNDSAADITQYVYEHWPEGRYLKCNDYRFITGQETPTLTHLFWAGPNTICQAQVTAENFAHTVRLCSLH